MTTPMPDDRLAEIKASFAPSTGGEFAYVVTAVSDLADLVDEVERLRGILASGIGVVVVTPMYNDAYPPMLRSAAAPPWGYPTPYATVQDAEQYAGSTATVCLLIPAAGTE